MSYKYVESDSRDLQSDPQSSYETPESGSSTFEAAINLSKLCIGSGILALPFAVDRGNNFDSSVISFSGLVEWGELLFNDSKQK